MRLTRIGTGGKFRLVAGLAVGLSIPGAFAATSPWDNYRLYLKGLLDERGGRNVQALEAYQEVLRRDPTASGLSESVVEVAMAAGRTEAALAAARRAVALSTGSAKGYILLGRVRLAQGENGEAQAAFDQALKIDPSNVEALGWAANRRQAADPQGARRLYEKFLTNNPDAEEVRTSLAEIQQRQGDLSAAEDSYKKILASDPSNGEARLGLAGLYDVRGDTAAAIAGYGAYLEGNPDNLDVLARLGQLCFVSGRRVEARDLFDHVLQLDPENRAGHFWRALVAEEEDRLDEAVRHMEQASRKSSEPGLLLRLASYYSRQGNNKEVLRVLHRLQRSQPENPDFMRTLAVAYEDLGKPRAAIRWLNRALAKVPDQADVHFHLAVNWDKLKRFDRAEKQLLRSIELEPNNPLALNYLGYSWADKNLHAIEALNLIQRAVALDPKNSAYQDSLGWALFRVGRSTEAEAALAPVVHVANDPVVWSHYGDVLEALGRGPEAARAWQEGLLLDPSDRGLLKKLGEEGFPARVVPVSAPRTLLKRVEGNYRQLAALSGLASVAVRSGGRSLTGRALFYYTRPGLFRLEVLGPFLAPQAVLIYDGAAHWIPPVVAEGEAGAWFALWGEVLSGKFFERFDDPSVTVRVEGKTLLYVAKDAELRLDARAKNLVKARIAVPGEDDVFLTFGSPREEDGVSLPLTVEGESKRGIRFTFRFSHVTVNPRLKPALFVPAP